MNVLFYRPAKRGQHSEIWLIARSGHQEFDDVAPHEPHSRSCSLKKPLILPSRASNAKRRAFY